MVGDRRDFLRQTAGAALAAACWPGTARCSPSDRVRLAIIGVRGMGFAHLQSFASLPDAEVATVCDVDESMLARAAETLRAATTGAAKQVRDFRHVLDDKSIDAVVIATPHHWHAPIAVRALQAGKDIYVEKPASHVFGEGRVIADAARKYNRIVQHGTQMRSSEVTAKAKELLAAGVIGEVKLAKAWNVQRHRHRAAVPDEPVPAGVDYDLWLGPAPKRPFNANRFHGNWQWYRDYGNGDIGNDGAHDLDLARCGLGVTTHPVRITAHGSRIALEGEREYPDNMLVAFQYAQDKVLHYEDRGWSPYHPYGYDSGNAFYGTEGWMLFTRRGFFQVYLGEKEELGPSFRGGTGHPEHRANFLACVRSREQPAANADVAHLSCALSHLGDVGYRVGRVLEFDPESERILHDPEADALLTKEYRAPWGVESV